MVLHVQIVWLDPSQDADTIIKWSAAMAKAFGHKQSPASHRRMEDLWPRLTLLYWTPDSVDQAVRETVTDVKALALVAGSACAIALFVLGAMYVPGKALPRTFLAAAGLTSVVLSIGAGLGFSLYIGIPFTSVTLVLPFILLGVGVDDIFMLVCTFASFQSAWYAVAFVTAMLAVVYRVQRERCFSVAAQ